MGNEFHDQAASDIVFIVIETPHPRFKREGDNLRIIIDLTLKEVRLLFVE
jgi:DnaJ homolog subfamily B member 4